MKLTNDQIDEILEYCYGHTHEMWAAKIVSIILCCDFREASTKLELYLIGE